MYPGITEDDNERPLMLFIHGLGSSKAIWFETAEWICTSYGYICVLVDLRGHGKSADAGLCEMKDDYNDHFFAGKTRSPDVTMIPSNNNYSLCRSADDLAIVIRTSLEHVNDWTTVESENSKIHRTATVPSDSTRNVRSVIAVGHSYGGNVAVELAVRHPSLVSDLVLVDGGYIDLQGTFPDFSSCLLALRPPSFAGLEYSELEHIVRSQWAMEGVKGGRNSSHLKTVSPDRYESGLLSVFSGGEEKSIRKISWSVPPGCWSEQGIQGVLQNFRSVDLNTTTVSGSKPNSSSSSTKVETATTRSSSTATPADNLSGHGRAADIHTGLHGKVNTIFSCVQTVLSFQRYVLLLEDLWLKRPVDQFKAFITGTRTLSNETSTVLEKNQNQNGAITSSAEDNVSHSSQCGTLKSVFFIPAGAPSPFSSNKDIDIKVAVEALQEVSELSVLSARPYVPVMCGVLEFALCGHNIPLQVPKELGDAIHTHLTGIHTHTADSHTHAADSHTHTADSHTHTADSHTHTADSHTHTVTNTQ
jgi:pimeloyl-ACP methyl ester carboxylesterase